MMFQLYIDEKHLEWVKEKAEQTKRSRASIVRELIENEIQKEEEEKCKENTK